MSPPDDPDSRSEGEASAVFDPDEGPPTPAPTSGKHRRVLEQIAQLEAQIAADARSEVPAPATLEPASDGVLMTAPSMDAAAAHVAPRALPEPVEHKTLDMRKIRLDEAIDPRRANTARGLRSPSAASVSTGEPLPPATSQVPSVAAVAPAAPREVDSEAVTLPPNRWAAERPAEVVDTRGFPSTTAPAADSSPASVVVEAVAEVPLRRSRPWMVMALAAAAALVLFLVYTGFSTVGVPLTGGAASAHQPLAVPMPDGGGTKQPEVPLAPAASSAPLPAPSPTVSVPTAQPGASARPRLAPRPAGTNRKPNHEEPLPKAVD
jgi:hypothetical protein